MTAFGPELPGYDERPCRGLNPEVFMPPRGDIGPVEAARAICRPCPVRQECLEYALEHNFVGVWGATSDRQRRQMKGRGRRIRNLRCDVCGQGFTSPGTGARYCGEECRRAGRAMVARKRPSRGVA